MIEIYNREVLYSTATFDTTPVTRQSPKSWIQDHCSERYPVLVAEDAGEIVGWTAVAPWSDRCAYARAAEVSVYIKDGRRGQRIGHKLLTRLMSEAQTAGLGVLLSRLSCGEGPASRNLHVSLGFTLVGTMHRVGEKFGRILDVDVLECQLDGSNAHAPKQEHRS